MNTLRIEDLPHSTELDREAMAELNGCGLWGSFNKYSMKAGRYVKFQAKSLGKTAGAITGLRLRNRRERGSGDIYRRIRRLRRFVR